ESGHRAPRNAVDADGPPAEPLCHRLRPPLEPILSPGSRLRPRPPCLRMDESRGGRLLRPVRPLRRHGLLTWAALATALLMNTLARRLEWAAAAIAVLGAIVTSPILYYIFVVPDMAHALVFAAAAALIWRLVRAHERPAAGSWLLVGAIAGLLFLVRWQAAVGLALVLSVGVTDVCRRRIAMVSLVVFARDWGRWGSGAGDRRAHPVRERLGHEWVGNDACGGRRFDRSV